MRRIINSTYVSLDGLIELLDRWQFDYLDDATAYDGGLVAPAYRPT
jgi:hypothetical protein